MYTTYFWCTTVSYFDWIEIDFVCLSHSSKDFPHDLPFPLHWQPSHAAPMVSGSSAGSLLVRITANSPCLARPVRSFVFFWIVNRFVAFRWLRPTPTVTYKRLHPWKSASKVSSLGSLVTKRSYARPRGGPVRRFMAIYLRSWSSMVRGILLHPGHVGSLTWNVSDVNR